MTRRRYLLSCLSEQYRQHLFDYVFHSLFPSTLDGRNLRNNGKDKLITYYGNSNVENQLVSAYYINTTTGITAIDNNDGSIIINGTSTARTSLASTNSISFISNHKYLIIGIKNIFKTVCL